MRKMMMGLAAVTMAVPAVSTPAMAQYYGGGGYYGSRDSHYTRHYDRNGYYNGPVWRGRDGRLYCRRSNGTTGLIIGAGAGALLGRAIDNRGSRATGTILGAAIGALLGREIQRNRSRNRCR